MKSKLKKYYSELRHFERQNPNSKISTQSVIIRLKEIIQSGYAFRLKGMSTVVTVTLTPNAETGWVDYKLSHYINTPEQMSKYVPNRQSGDYLEYALLRGVTTITDFYKIAVRNGHIPDDSWLIANS